MSFQSYNELADIINERLNAQEMLDVKREIQEQIVSFTDEQRKIFFSVLEDIELQRASLIDLLAMLQEKIPLDSDIAKKVALKLWSEYFFMVQDYYGSCIELINAHGGSVATSAQRAKSFLHPHRQLKRFIQRTLYEFSPERSEEYQYKLIDQLIDRALQKTKKHDVMEHFTLFFQSEGISNIDAGKLADAIELLVLSEAFSAQHALYYLGLADNVINALSFVEISAIEVPKIEEKKPNQEEYIRELRNAFDRLPSQIKDVFLSEEMQKKIKEYSASYPDFEMIFIRAVVKDIQLNDIALFLNKELHLGPERASELRDEIIKTFFEPVMWYYTGAPKSDGVVAAAETSTVSEITSVSSAPAPASQAAQKSDQQVALKEPLRARTCESYEALADEIIEQSKIQCDEDGVRRIRAVLMTRIRNIRTNIETQERLIEEGSKGGCSIAADVANALTIGAATFAEGVQKGLIRVGKIDATPTAKPRAEALAKADKPLKTEIPKLTPEASSIDKAQVSDHIPLVEEKSPQPQPKPEPTKPLQPPSESMAKPPLPLIKSEAQPRAEVAPKLPKAKEDEVAPKLEEQRRTASKKLAIEEIDGIPMLVDKPAGQISKITSQPAKQNITPLKVEVRSTPPAMAKAISVTDVKKTPHLVGPIDELQSMSLKDFRRMSADASAAARRIRDKIQTLEKESLSKKMEAIDAWKRSEVNQLYIEIGKESFGKGVPIAQAIQQRKNDGLPYLEEVEFDALLDLNTMLRH